MTKIILVVALLIIQATSAEAQIRLSEVNTGDCVADRIQAKRTAFVDELDKKYCARNRPDEAKEKKCIESSRSLEEFSFFTDRCSEDEYFIGINGEEVRLRRISKKPGRPHYFIGSFAGRGVAVEIKYPGLIKKTNRPAGAGDEDRFQIGRYKVIVTVKKGTLKKTFKGSLLYGR